MQEQLRVVVLLIYTHSSMVKYESKQPEVVMDELIEQLEKGDISSVNFTVGNKFEDVTEFAEDFVESVKGKEKHRKLRF